MTPTKDKTQITAEIIVCLRPLLRQRGTMSLSSDTANHSAEIAQTIAATNTPVSNMPSPPRAVFTQNCRYANEIGVDMPRSRRWGGVRAPFPAHCFDGGEPFQEFTLCRDGRARFEIEAVGGKAA